MLAAGFIVSPTTRIVPGRSQGGAGRPQRCEAKLHAAKREEIISTTDAKAQVSSAWDGLPTAKTKTWQDGYWKSTSAEASTTVEVAIAPPTPIPANGIGRCLVGAVAGIAVGSAASVSDSHLAFPFSTSAF